MSRDPRLLTRAERQRVARNGAVVCLVVALLVLVAYCNWPVAAP